MDLEVILLRKQARQKETNTIRFQLHVESKTKTETDSQKQRAKGWLPEGRVWGGWVKGEREYSQ